MTNNKSLLLQTIGYVLALAITLFFFRKDMALFSALAEIGVIVLVTLIVITVVFLIIKQLPAVKYLLRGADNKANQDERKTAIHLLMVIIASVFLFMSILSPQIMINSNEGSVDDVTIEVVE